MALQACQHLGDHFFVGFGAFVFVAQLLYFHRSAACHASHGFQHFWRSLAECYIVHHGLDPSRGDELSLQRDDFSYPLLGTLQPVGQHRFVHFHSPLFIHAPGVLGAAGFHHHYGHIGLPA